MKQKIDVWDYAGKIISAMPQGILITTKANDKVNTMTIGWGMLGIEWARPLFITYVRESRYTRQMLEANGEFTINAPLTEVDKNILSFCGTKSGRDVDKIKELGLTLEEPEVISVPGIKELPITLECRILYTQPQNPKAIPQEIIDRSYPVINFPVTGEEKRDFHTAYYAEIVSAYIIK